MAQVNAQFDIDVERLHQIGAVDPKSSRSLEIFRSAQLNSNERLYLSLWSSKELNSASFDARKRIFTKGEEVPTAFFIVSGSLLAVDGDLIERLGPGSVIGLAEGIRGLPCPRTVITVTPVQARALPLGKILHIIPTLPQVLQRILFNIAKRAAREHTAREELA